MLVWLDAHAASAPQPLTWVDPTPSALQPFDGSAESVAELAGDTMLVYPQPKQSVTLPYSQGPKTYRNVQYVSGALVVNASPEQVASVLSDYAGYPKLYPKLTAAKVEAQDQHGEVTRSVVRYHILIKIPVPLLTFDEDVVLQHDRTPQSISTLVLDSPIQYGSAKFEWYGLKNGKTLVTLTQWGDLDRPKGFLVNTVLRALPEAKLGIPTGLEGFVLESLRLRFNPDPTSPVATPYYIAPDFALNERQEAKVLKLLQQGGVVQFSHRPVWYNVAGRSEKLSFATSYGMMPVSVEQSKAAFATPVNYPEIYRQVRKVTSEPLPNGSLQNDIKIGLGLGVLSIPMHLKLNYKPESEYSTRFYATGGDVQFMQGRYVLKAVNAQYTLVGLTTASKLGDNPPLLLKLAKYLPYPDYIPVVGAAPVLFDKSRNWLIKQAKP